MCETCGYPHWRDEACAKSDKISYRRRGAQHEWGDVQPGSNRGDSGTPTDKNNRGEGYGRNATRGAFCRKCGVWRGCLGLEPTPELYVSHLVAIFREVRRVLRDDGTVWLNIGDTYTSGGRKDRNPGKSKLHPAFEGDNFTYGLRPDTPPGLKPKDLVGTPWRVAFALQADGWYLRSDIIWAKPNPMPENVRDRPTKSHEYLFLLSKSERYYYDAEAISEPLERPEETSRKTPALFGGANKWKEAKKQSRLHSGNQYTGTSTGRRNKRTVWTIAPQRFPEEHFATYPEALVEPCIIAGCPEAGTVLDPFHGSGTTGVVALRQHCRYVGIEPSEKYIQISLRRLEHLVKQKRLAL